MTARTPGRPGSSDREYPAQAAGGEVGAGGPPAGSLGVRIECQDTLEHLVGLSGRDWTFRILDFPAARMLMLAGADYFPARRKSRGGSTGGRRLQIRLVPERFDTK